MSTSDYLTIGQLASRVGLRTSALRFYEEQGLIEPDGRTEAGYRLYGPNAEATLRLIQRAQRLGLSLDDIRQLLQAYRDHNLSDEKIIQIVEARALALQRQLTALLVLQHELDLFLQDIRHENDVAPAASDHTGRDHFDALLQRICLNPHSQTARDWLSWLIESVGCRLSSEAGRAILKQLSGIHCHIWEEDTGYHILVVGDDPVVGSALAELADLEAECEAPAHSDLAAQLDTGPEGFHFTVTGENAFIYARLFLALERS